MNNSDRFYRPKARSEFCETERPYYSHTAADQMILDIYKSSHFYTTGICFLLEDLWKPIILYQMDL